MSDLAAFGIGIGMGLIMMTIVVIYLRDELIAGFKRLFGDPRRAKSKPPAKRPSQPS